MPAGAAQLTKTDLYNGSTLRVVTDGYDAAGRMTTQTSTGAGLTTLAAAYSYDVNSNMTGVTTTDGGGTTPNVSAIGIGYTSANEEKAVTETVYTPTGTSVTKLSSSTWAEDGLISSATTDGLGASYGYNLDGTEASTSAPGYGTLSSSYFPDGSVSQTAMPGAATSQSYDAAGRLSAKVVTGPGGITLASWTGMTYDGDDQLSATAVTLAQAANQPTLSWNGVNVYSSQGYLAAAQGPGDSAPVSFNPDNAGNMQASRTATMSYVNNQLMYETSTATGAVAAFSYNHLGQESSATTGSKVTTTVYDAAGNPSVVTSPDGSRVTYSYDALGRMVSRQDSSPGGSSELDFYGGTGSQIVETTDLSGNDADTPTVHYLLDSSGSPIAQETNSPSAGTWGSYVTDPHDNMSQLLSTTGTVEASYSYDLFGNQVVTSTVAGWTSRLLFQMAPIDPKLGVYNLGPRLLDPTVGRFVSVDNAVASLSDFALQSDPLTGNRYLYAGANPAGMIDNGYMPCSATACGYYQPNEEAAFAQLPAPLPTAPTNDTATSGPGGHAPLALAVPAVAVGAVVCAFAEPCGAAVIAAAPELGFALAGTGPLAALGNALGIIPNEAGAAEAELIPSSNAFDAQAQALAQRIGGQAQVEFASGPNAGREFDAISDEFLAQAKPADFNLGSAFRAQARATFQAAVDTGRIPYFQFNGPPGPGVLETLARYGTEFGVQPVIDLKPLGG